MLIRKCAKGSKVYIFKPRTKENITYKFSDETISFDAQNKSYIVVSDGAVIKRTDSFSTAQSSFLKELSIIFLLIKISIKSDKSFFNILIKSFINRSIKF